MVDVETEMVGSYKIRIVVDEDPMSPRDADCLASMVLKARHYELPNDVDFPFGSYSSWGEVADALRDEYGAVVLLPVFMIDHSGTSFRTRDFEDCDPGSWDSGQVGFIFASDAQIREWHMLAAGAPITPEIVVTVRKGLQAEIDEYDAWARGEAYGFIIETAETTFKLEADGSQLMGTARIVEVPPGEEVTSCWGFIGDMEYCLTEARAAVPD